MDTRTKIVSIAQASRLAAEGAIVVTGYFDPLTAPHARQLRESKRDGRPLLAAIAEPPEPILPLRARMELVAALAAVDYVTEAVEALRVDVDLRAGHAREFEELIEHVHGRQGASA